MTENSEYLQKNHLSVMRKMQDMMEKMRNTTNEMEIVSEKIRIATEEMTGMMEEMRITGESSFIRHSKPK
jgi:hypothetical protein